MNKPLPLFASVVAVVCLFTASSAQAQPLGTFSWQLQPFCNRVTINVTQNGAVYTFDGWDDQCGGSNPRAPLVGTGTVNPDGTIGFGLNIVTAPGGAALHIDATITLPSVGGTWRDSAGYTGAFVLGAASGGPARPAVASGDITGVTAGTGLTGGGTTGTVTLSSDPAVVQTRITAACPSGQSMVSVNQNGSVNCQAPSGGGTITSVNTPPGSGLAGGASGGDVTLAVDPTIVQSRIGAACPAGQLMASVNQNGTVNCQTPAAAGGGTITAVNTPAGSGLTGGAASGSVTLGVAFGGAGTAPLAARSDHTHAALGTQNLGIGPNALAALTAGSIGHTAVGHSALSSVTGGQNNTAVGNQALKLVTSSNNTAVGAGTLQALTTGTSNTGVGNLVLPNLVSGSDNTSMGLQSLFASTSGSRNTAIGAFALSTGNASDNTAIGYAALAANTSGVTNVAVGANALDANTSGTGNVAIGNNALGSNTSASGNIAIGVSSMVQNTTAGQNVAIGNSTLAANTTGFWNVAVGDSTLPVANGVANTGLGQSALNVNTTGGGNTAVGAFALDDNTTGIDNTAVGMNTLSFVTTGSLNIAIGRNAGDFLTTGSNNIYLGATAGAAAEATTTRVGSAQTRAFIAGIRGVTTGLNNAVNVVIDSNGQLGTASSSRRTKDDIANLPDSISSRLQLLRPVQFRYKQPFADDTQPLQYGLIAEEVEAVMPELVAYNSQGEVETVKYQVLPSLLLAEVQRLEKERAEMKGQAEAMARELAELRTLVVTLLRQR